MRQQLLDWGSPPAQTLDTFVAGQNAELAQLMRLVAAGAADTPGQRFIYLWGAAGAGKTHLLRALETVAGARYIAPDADADAFQYVPQFGVFLLDDCDRLDADAQIAAFNLFNQVRDNSGVLVATGNAPPLALQVREDLRTRLGWGLIYQVHGLSDDEKIAALTQAAQARGFAVAADVLPYLITHFKRDMRSLNAMLDALDRYSLETKRPVTLPLLRSLLQLEGPLSK